MTPDIEKLEAALTAAEAFEAPADGIAYGDDILQFADIRALLAERKALREALERIADLTKRQQLPITAQVHEAAVTALNPTQGNVA